MPDRPPPCGNMGDVDGDGMVTPVDADLVARYVANIITLTPEQLARADVDGSGEVDVFDGMMIAQYVEGVINTFPVCATLPPGANILISGVEYTATVSLPVKPAGMSCVIELWLSVDGITKAATSGVIAFMSTGVDQSFELPVVMPAGGYVYRVFIEIWADGITIGSYEATEPVAVPLVEPPVVVWD